MKRYALAFAIAACLTGQATARMQNTPEEVAGIQSLALCVKAAADGFATQNTPVREAADMSLAMCLKETYALQGLFAKRIGETAANELMDAIGKSNHQFAMTIITRARAAATMPQAAPPEKPRSRSF